MTRPGDDELNGEDGNSAADVANGEHGSDDLDGEDGIDSLDGGTGLNDPQYIDQGWFGPNDPYWAYSTLAGYNGDYAVSKVTQASPHYWVPATTYMGYQELFATWVGGTGDADVEYYVNHRGDADMTSADQTQAPPDDFPDDPLAWKKLGGSEYVRYVYDGVTSVETDPWRYDYEQPPDIRTTCIDAVLIHHVLPLCDIDTDSRNDDGVIDAEDNPVENADAGPGRIVPVGSSQLTEVHLQAAPVDAVLAMPQDWRACLWSPSGGGHIRIWDTPDKQHELHFPTTGADWWDDVLTPTDTCWAITTANPLDLTIWVEGLSAGTTHLELAVGTFTPEAQSGPPLKSAMAGWTDTTKHTVINAHVDLEAKKILHNQPDGDKILSETEEDSPARGCL